MLHQTPMSNCKTPISSCITSEAQGEGLKFIASTVQKVLMQKKVVTYDELLQNVNVRNKSTLKRRVYDVLSVMRALNLVKKEDKQYVVSAHTHAVELNERIAEKRRRLDDLVGIKTALMYLIKRNMAMTKWAGGVHEVEEPFKGDVSKGFRHEKENACSGHLSGDAEKENDCNKNHENNGNKDCLCRCKGNGYDSNADFKDKYKNDIENSNIFTLPFLVVMANKSSNVHCETDEDRKFFRFKCTSRLIILDDLKVLKIIYDEKESHGMNQNFADVCFQKQRSDYLDFFI